MGKRNTQNSKKERRNEDTCTKPNYKYSSLKRNAQYWMFGLTGPQQGGGRILPAAGGGQDAEIR